jgi:hypothetical protein
MYPERELTRLAARKSGLRQAIALRRVHLAGTAARAAWPLAWLDRVLAVGSRLPPFTLLAALPFGCVVARSVFSSLKGAGSLVMGMVRGVRFAAGFFSRPRRSAGGQ